MAKYLSVEEVADILGKTDRTVRRMLNAGQLAGSQHPEKGKLVWRVHATKDLVEKLESKFQQSPFSVDAETIIPEPEVRRIDEEEAAEADFVEFQSVQKQAMKTFADELMRPVGDKISELSMLIGEKDREIAEMNRQLRLLPDLEKRAREEQEAAEKERKIAEEKTLEVAALSKQIEALLADKAASEQTVQQAALLSTQMTTMQAQIEELKKPFWKKFFGSK